MPNKRLSEVKVGIFVFFAALIVLLTVFWAKGFIIEKSQHDLIAYFPSISGLNLGDPVTVNGVKKGKILDIDIKGDSVVVRFSVEKEVKIRKDYKIEISVLELMGGKQLYIFPGKESEEIDYEKPLKGESVSDISQIIKDVAGMAGDVKLLLKKFDKTTDNLNDVLLNINDIVGDKSMKSDLKSTLANLQVTSYNLRGLVAENKVTLKELTGKIGNTVDNVSGLVGETRPSLQNTFKDIQTLTTRVDTLVGNLNIIVSDIHNQKSGVGKFIYDDKFFEELNKTLNEVQTLSKKIRKEGIKIDIF
jgi:phospholipid/cholesterol/gamma-HCH transport system substrate-binding protein